MGRAFAIPDFSWQGRVPDPVLQVGRVLDTSLDEVVAEEEVEAPEAPFPGASTCAVSEPPVPDRCVWEDWPPRKMMDEMRGTFDLSFG